ncbi:hypothetical protein OG995_21005 [Micromonospora zamorensis]
MGDQLGGQVQLGDPVDRRADLVEQLAVAFPPVGQCDDRRDGQPDRVAVEREAAQRRQAVRHPGGAALEPNAHRGAVDAEPDPGAAGVR